MESSAPVSHGGRETRLLLVTIAVSIGVLFLLSRFRFPEQAADAPAMPAAAPLERLAARAAYDELASTMADLERRLTGSVVVLPVSPQRDTGGFVVAPRVTADRAVTLVRTGEALPGDAEGTSRVISTEPESEIAIVAVAADENAVVTPRSGPPRPGPRYVVSVEGSADGLTVRPVYVGRTSTLQDARTSTPLLTLSGLQHPLPRGAAVFSLEGTFIGLVVNAGTTTTVIPGDFLRQRAETAVPASPSTAGSLGVELDVLGDALARATTATTGIIVTAVQHPLSSGTLQPGDVIQAVDATPVLTVASFRDLEQALVPGQRVTVSIVRSRKPEKLTIAATDRRLSPQPAPAGDEGLVGRSIPDTGIEVLSVASGSPAERAGLLRGDVIITTDGRSSDDATALRNAFTAAPAGTAWVLTVRRGTQHRALALEKR